jgi:nucleoside-diphosphate-sugar epimerase
VRRMSCLSIPPDERCDPALEYHTDMLDAASGLEWLCYFSTVGVYGDFGGAWVDETAPTRPVNARSQLRVACRAAVARLCRRARRAAVDPAPRRHLWPRPFGLRRLRDGTARRIVKPNQVFNRIHVDDIGRATALAAMQKLDGTFNLGDDEPAPPQDLVSYAAALMGVPAPPDTPFETAR